MVLLLSAAQCCLQPADDIRHAKLWLVQLKLLSLRAHAPIVLLSHGGNSSNCLSLHMDCVS